MSIKKMPSLQASFMPAKEFHASCTLMERGHLYIKMQLFPL